MEKKRVPSNVEFRLPQPDVEQKKPDTSNEHREPEDVYTAGEVIGRGGSSTAYEVVGHPELILREIGGEWGGKQDQEVLRRKLQRAEQKIQMFEKLPAGINAPKILKAWVEDGGVREVMERALGKPLHNRKATFDEWAQELQVLADVPLEHYQKLISDMAVLHDIGFQVDRSKPDNIFYDPATGFHFIDLEPGKYLGSLVVPLVHTYHLFTKYGDEITPEVRQAVTKILEKVSAAGDFPNPSMQLQIQEKIDEISGNSRQI